MKNELKEKKYGAISFLPLIVFLVLYIGSGIFFTLMGAEGAFKKFPRHVALLAGIIVALLMNKGMKLEKKIDIFSENAGNPGVILKGVGSEMKDKFKMNFFIALPAAIFAAIMYGIMGGNGNITGEYNYHIIRVLPYIVVLITALIGFNVSGVLVLGIAMTGIIGLLEGNITFLDWIGAIGEGMSDMFSITIVAILISGLIGLVKYYGGIEWLVNSITSKIKNRKNAEYGIGLISGLLSAALVNNTIAIIITAPIAKEIGQKYNIVPKRLASLIDIFACAFLALTPYDGGMLMVTALVDVSPLEVLKYSFYIFALIVTTCITIQFGLLRTKEEKNN